MTPQERGFTLIELAIVMLVLTILAAGVLVPLTKRIEIQRYEETQKILEEAREALIGYAMSHKDINGKPYLPCPDKMTAANPTSNFPNDGIEDRVTTPGGCETQEGNFPWATLGVGRIDAWGNQLRYRVIKDYSRSDQGFDNSTKVSLATDQLQVCNPACTPTSNDSIPVISAIIVSHGPNGWGALNSNGTVQAAPTGADEIENTNGDTKFISRAPTPASATTTEFDDIVVWLPTTLLVSRVCFSASCT